MKRQLVDVVLVGGGSGGHLTPLIPVSHSLKTADQTLKIAHIGQRGDPMNSILDSVNSIDEQYYVSAGKYRRYNGESLFAKISDIKTFAWNVRDFFRFIKGVVQSWFLLGKLRPKAILMKGGYVCAPVGIAAAMRKIPYVTHDSDAMVSLAHRIIAKRASLHLTALPKELYSVYDQQKTIQVGVPVRDEYRQRASKEAEEIRTAFGYTTSDGILLIMGGGLGSRNINNAIVKELAAFESDGKVHIIHITGHGLFDEVKKAYDRYFSDNKKSSLAGRVTLLPFVDDLYRYSAIADVIVTRAGATTLAELAVQAKACIIVPNPLLSGGHQIKNAQGYASQNAVLVVEEKNISTQLVDTALHLLHDKQSQKELESAIRALGNTNAANTIAEHVINIMRLQNQNV